ncbi:MAG: zinc ribbon domain-containing protein [Fidelibacterota bacterium]
MSQLDQLIKLQEIDTALIELERLKGDLPGKIEELTRNMEQIDAALHGNESRLKDLELEIRHAQGTEVDQKVKLDRLQEQLYLVKTNREYDALMTEIDHLKNDMDEAELKELELSEEKDRLEEQMKLDRLNRETMASELEDRKKELEKTTASTESESRRLLARREKVTPEIDSRYLALYDRVRSARDGVAVVPIVNHSCGGCHSRITSQAIVEIRSGDTIAQCPVCRRILFWPGD